MNLTIGDLWTIDGLVSINVHEDTGSVWITVRGRFDLNLQATFRSAYEKVGKKSPIVVDLTAVDYMDSAGLGLLLLLREHAGDGPMVKLHGMNSKVATILRIANFHRLFVMVPAS
jgi:anti-anti-sigma factor